MFDKLKKWYINSSDRIQMKVQAGGVFLVAGGVGSICATMLWGWKGFTITLFSIFGILSLVIMFFAIVIMCEGK